MIIDSHCHAWERWPYEPPVPDFHGKGRFEQLLNEMDLNGVDQAFLVCAGIEHNPQNNEYIARMSKLYSGRIRQVADVDCSWSKTYHTPGAADRLRKAAGRWSLQAFTHYMKPDDDGSWLYGEDGLAFFGTAVEMGLIASIACAPHHHAALHRVAERFPQLPIFIHHMGHPGVGEKERLAQVLASARFENIGVKVSGFYYSTKQGSWDFPYADSIREIVRPLYDTFGPERLYWGSDYPVCLRSMTYPQAIECFRSHCSFIGEADQALIMGENLRRLLDSDGDR
ncbi:MAG: amidohydrolase family protein [Caldilineaceae bacterium]|nr:amidohydrolase family protein [Caldilineaceae bacterium]